MACSQHADVLIVGAGPGGSTAAFLLARRGWKVLLLDRARFPREKTCGDGLTPRAVMTLQRLGLEEKVAAQAFQVNRARLYAAPDADLDLPFNPFVAPLPPHGYVLPRFFLDDLLRHEAQEAGALLEEDAFVQGVIQEKKVVRGVWGRLGERPCKWHAQVTIVATGASIKLHKALGLLRSAPHDVIAARGYWQGVDGLKPRFEFFFTTDVSPGYAWIFPVKEDMANIGVGVFAPPGREAPHPTHLLRRFLENHDEIRQRLATAKRIGDIRSYPIRTDYPSHPVCGPGWLMVGEAAGLVNPATGEGIDLAMESAILAADAVHQALSQKGHVLCSYTHRLRRTFARTFKGLRRLRPRVMRPRALGILIRRAQRHPGLAARIMRITLGTESPYAALLPSTWWWILRGG